MEIRERGLSKCVFHDDRTPSLSVTPSGKFGADLFNCFGCGASGDVVSFLARLAGVDRRTAFKAVLHGFTPAVAMQIKPNSKPRQSEAVSRFHEIELEEGSDADFQSLSELRGISEAGLRLAADRGFVRFGRYSGERAWAVVDHAAKSLQFRPLRAGTWFGGRKAMCPQGVSTRVPLGLSQLDRAQRIHLMEGGPDFLAAHQLILALADTQVDSWAAIGFLGASIEPSPEACHALTDKDVVIWAHADAPGIKSALRKLELITPHVRSVSVMVASELIPAANDLNDLIKSPGGMEAILARREVFHV
jgi:DNA primase